MTDSTQALFTALAEPHRRLILDQLRKRDCSAGELGRGFDLSQPTVSKHLKVLRQVGLVSVKRRAQERWYHLEMEKLRTVDDWLEPYRQAWATQLDTLGDYLDGMLDD